MNYEFKLPDVGEGISEAELLEWKVAIGDAVTEEIEIAVVSTDKVTVELPCPCAGVVRALHGKPGDVIAVGEVLAVIERGAAQAGQPKADAAPTKTDPDPGASAPAAPSARGAALNGHDLRTAPVPAAPRAGAASGHVGPVIAAPSTRKMARELGVELVGLTGSGPGGRILRADVQTASQGETSVPAQPAPVHSPSLQESPGVHRLPLRGGRAVAARNLLQSVQRAVTTTSTFEVPGDGVRGLIPQLASVAERRGLKLSPMHVVAKCVAAALMRHPRFNATIDEASGDLLLHDRVDLGVAVAAPEGLVVPVIRGVNARLLLDVVAESAALASRAREGKLGIADLRGGTFTLSSTGGLERTTMLSTRPIIAPPQTAILWVSRITDRPRVLDGELCAGPMMTCSLSFDHRYIDGAEATLFINELAGYLQNPQQALA